MSFPRISSPYYLKRDMIILEFFLTFYCVIAQNSSMEDMPSTMVSNFQASLAVVISILSLMFLLTFVLLVYARFCRTSTTTRVNDQPFFQSNSRSSGIDKTVIESLPFFRFSSIKGAREGLDCAVCLSRFEDIEILRLLPKCKHAFHIHCVDQWLEKHSTCPLCRQKVKADDVTFFVNSTSLRFSHNQSERLDESNLGIFIQREEDERQSHRGSSRFSIGGSFRGSEKNIKEEELPIQELNKEEILHSFNHKIIVSDEVLKNRWSSSSSPDFMFLNSEKINATSSNRFSSFDQYNATKFSKICQNDKRSMSEIIVHPRFKENKMKDGSSSSRNDLEGRVRRIWSPFSGKTGEWFANREIIRPPESHNIGKSSNV